MADSGAALQNYNVELVRCIENLCMKRDDVHTKILQEEEEKQGIEKDMRVLSTRLNNLNVSLENRKASRDGYDNTIKQTESAYLKILESSQSLLTVLKDEGNSLHQMNHRK